MDFEIIGEITQIETIAQGHGVRNLARLQRQYGKGRWRKLKGVAYVRLIDGSVRFLKFIGTKHRALVRGNPNLNSRFLINDG